MAVVVWRWLCFSCLVSLLFLIPFRNKPIQNLLSDAEECFFYKFLQLPLFVRGSLPFYSCRNGPNTYCFRKLRSVYAKFSENFYNVAELSTYNVVCRSFENATVKKYVEICGVLTKFSTLEVDPQTHERHLVFQISLSCKNYFAY